MSKPKKYWTNEKIKKIGAQFNILFSVRSTGKSYATKVEVIKTFLEKGQKFVYLRRWRKDCTATNAMQYFYDIPIKILTDGQYETIYAYAGGFYLANYGEDGKVKKGPHIGWYMYLEGYEHYKSMTYPDAYNIIFEEFISNEGYMRNETGLLMNIVSTVLRDNDGVVWLIANTITRVCPYVQDWKLKPFQKMKEGEIYTVTYKRKGIDNEDIETKIAVELCENPGTNSKMFIGLAGRNITENTWEVVERPHFPEDGNFTKVYDVTIKDMGFQFCMSVYVDESTGGMFLYVTPSEKHKTLRTISKQFSVDPLTTNRFSDTIKIEQNMRSLLNLGKICYSDNTTATDFENIVKNWEGSL